VVRVVVELEEWKPYRIKLGEDRRKLEIEFPLPDHGQLPTEAPPVTLSGMSFRRISPRLAEVTLSLFGDPRCESGATEEPPAVWVDLPNADNRLTAQSLEVRDRLVSGASVGPAPGKPGAQRLTVALRQPSEYVVSGRRGEVRVLLGRCELGGVCVAVDPGHGGPDTGAIGRSGLLEKDVNLDIALRVSRLLEETGARVVLTRSNDQAAIPWTAGNTQEHRRELLARCDLANASGAQLLVSIHANARVSNPESVRGTETYYRKPDSREPAELIQEELVRAAGLPDGGTKYHPKPIIVLYRTNMPAVLVEVGYLSNRQDEQKLADPDFREQAAQGIVNGIKRWLLTREETGGRREEENEGALAEKSREELSGGN
jgi:N-acetylmuramoyl-L-alanine amidase CwlD